MSEWLSSPGTSRRQNKLTLNENAVQSKRRWNNAVRSKNERVQLEVEILKYRNFLLFVEDEEFRKTLTAKVAELEKKLREIDE